MGTPNQKIQAKKARIQQEQNKEVQRQKNSAMVTPTRHIPQNQEKAQATQNQATLAAKGCDKQTLQIQEQAQPQQKPATVTPTRQIPKNREQSQLPQNQATLAPMGREQILQNHVAATTRQLTQLRYNY